MITKGVMKNENGSVLIITLIILVALTFLGITSTRMSSIDLLISGNMKTYTQNLYNAEAAAYHAVQAMEFTDLEGSPPSWVSNTLGDVTEADVMDDANWDNDSFTGLSVGTDIADAKYLAYFADVTEIGMSLDMAKTKIRAFAIYGRSEKGRGKSMVEIGFRKAY
jgi:hypothetical protein